MKRFLLFSVIFLTILSNIPKANGVINFEESINKLGPGIGAVQNVAVNSDLNKIYLFGDCNNVLRVIDEDTKKIVKNVTISEFTYNYGFLDDMRHYKQMKLYGNKLFLYDNTWSNYIIMLDCTIDEVIKKIQLDTKYEYILDVCYNSKNNYLYVVTYNFLICLNIDSLKILNEISNNYGYTNIELNTNSHILFVLSNNKISFLDENNFEIKKEIILFFNWLRNKIIVNDKLNQIYLNYYIIDCNTYEVKNLSDINENITDSIGLNKEQDTLYAIGRDSFYSINLFNITLTSKNITWPNSYWVDCDYNINTNIISIILGDRRLFILNTFSKNSYEIFLGYFFENFVLGNNKLYISTHYLNSIIIYDCLINKVIKMIPFEESITGLMYDIKSDQIIVSFNNSIKIIDGKKDEILIDIPYNSIITDIPYNFVILKVQHNSISNSIYISYAHINATLYKTTNIESILYNTIVINGTNYKPIINYDYLGNIYVNYKTKIIYVYLHDMVNHTYIGKITVINGTTNKIIKTIDSVPFLNGFIINPFSNKIYTTMAFSDSLKKVDEDTMTIMGDIKDVYARAITFDPNNLIYVISNDSNTLVILNEKSEKIIKNISLSDNPLKILYNDKINKIYVLHGYIDTLTIIRIPVIHSLFIKTEPLNITAISGEGQYEQETSIITGAAPTIINGVFGTRYYLLGWILNGSSQSENPLSLTMNTTYEAVAKYKTQHYLTVRSDYGNPQGEGWYDAGSTATFSVTSPVGGIGVQHIFIGWSIDSEETTTTATILMDGPQTVYAKWRTDYTQSYVIGTGVVVTLAIIVVALTRLRKN